MIGKGLVFFCVLLFVAIQMNRVNAEPIFNTDFLKLFNLQGMNSQFRNLYGPVSTGISDIAGMAQSMNLPGVGGGSEKQEPSSGASLFKLLSP